MNYTTQNQVRAAFWEDHDGPDSFRAGVRKFRIRDRTGNLDWTTETRCAFVDFVDYLARDGQISDALAQRVTL